MNDESDFLSMLLLVMGVGGVIFALAAVALVMFWRSLEGNPGGAAEKGSEGARVNRGYFISLGALLLIVVLLSFTIFWMG